MNKTRKYKFYVIEFTKEQLKNNNLSKHVCIPASWIGFGNDEINEKVVIMYPKEDGTVTKKRVEDMEHFNENWPIYENVTLNYGTDSFLDAMKCAEILSKGLKESDGIESTSMDDTPHTVSPKSHVTSGEHIIEIISNNLPNLPDIKMQSNIEQELMSKTLPEKQTLTANKNNYMTKLSLDRKLTPISPEILQVTPDTLKSNVNPDYDKENNISRHDNPIPVDLVTVDQPQPKITDWPELSLLLGEWDFSFEANHMMVNRLKSASERNCANVKKLISIVKEYHEFINNTIVVSNNEENSDTDDDNHNEENSNTDDENHNVENSDTENDNYYEENSDTEDENHNVENSDTENENHYEEPHEHYEITGEQEDCSDKLTKDSEFINSVEELDSGLEKGETDTENEYEQLNAVKRDDQNEVGRQNKKKKKIYLTDSDKDDQTIEEKCNTKRKLHRYSLPSSYDEHDSRWTLRYRVPDDSLIELGNSGVYVHRSGLRYIERSCYDVKTLAQNMLTPIFSDSALRTCTIIGKKVNEFKSKKIRPGLDQNAIDALITYAIKFAQEKGWAIFDKHLIMGALHTKLLQLREELCYSYFQTQPIILEGGTDNN